MRSEQVFTGIYLEVSYELLYDGLPRDETFDEDIGWTKVMCSDVLLDERLGTRYG
jgi:hypothetical protein